MTPKRTKIKSIKSKKTFQGVFDKGQKWVTPHFILWVEGDLEGVPLLGLSASKKLFSLATQRNKAKRRLKEAFREAINENLPFYQSYVVIARKGSIEADFQKLVKDMKWALRKLSDLKK